LRAILYDAVAYCTQMIALIASHPFLISSGVCILAAVAEEILAGKGPMKFLATPLQPRCSLSPWISIIMGFLLRDFLSCASALAPKSIPAPA
jgi:hypothetical protein